MSCLATTDETRTLMVMWWWNIRMQTIDRSVYPVGKKRDPFPLLAEFIAYVSRNTPVGSCFENIKIS
jgi:hypothetical protein